MKASKQVVIGNQAPVINPKDIQPKVDKKVLASISSAKELTSILPSFL